MENKFKRQQNVEAIIFAFPLPNMASQFTISSFSISSYIVHLLFVHFFTICFFCSVFLIKINDE